MSRRPPELSSEDGISRVPPQEELRRVCGLKPLGVVVAAAEGPTIVCTNGPCPCAGAERWARKVICEQLVQMKRSHSAGHDTNVHLRRPIYRTSYVDIQNVLAQ